VSVRWNCGFKWDSNRWEDEKFSKNKVLTDPQEQVCSCLKSMGELKAWGRMKCLRIPNSQSFFKNVLDKRIGSLMDKCFEKTLDLHVLNNSSSHFFEEILSWRSLRHFWSEDPDENWLWSRLLIHFPLQFPLNYQADEIFIMMRNAHQSIGWRICFLIFDWE